MGPMEGAPGGDAELVCKTLQVEHKLFYFDLKENPRGRYLKISEKTSGSRSTIIVPVAGIVWFVDLFNYYANGEEELSSKELQLDTKVSSSRTACGLVASDPSARSRDLTRPRTGMRSGEVIRRVCMDVALGLAGLGSCCLDAYVERRVLGWVFGVGHWTELA